MQVRLATIVALWVGLLSVSTGLAIPPEVAAGLDRISAARLEKHLSYIASDELKGRDTPSPGLDLAAEYIAADFKDAGLEPIGDDGTFFQAAQWSQPVHDPARFSAYVRRGTEIQPLSISAITARIESELQLNRAPVYRVDVDDADALKAMEDVDLADAVILCNLRDYRAAPREAMRDIFRARQSIMRVATDAGAKLLLTIDRDLGDGEGLVPGGLRREDGAAVGRSRSSIPMITLHSPAMVAMFDELESGMTDATLNLTLPDPEIEPVRPRNVVGLLRGSDPELRDTYVIVTAHYDHVGEGPEVDGDSIFNGANDDGSGTVTVMEIARAMASMDVRPKRSVIFMTVFGEERGLLGSRHYVKNPIVPLIDTIGNVNIEQVGRTDSTDGPRIKTMAFTGHDYSTLPAVLEAAASETGIEVLVNEADSASYFGRSDNVAFAGAGIPAHTICVAFQYPDYHGRGDHADKIDYENMASVNRALALGIWKLADASEVPKWNEDHRRTGAYVKAAAALKEPADDSR